MKKLRKAFIISVMSITVLSTTMFAVPMQVGAAAQAGDLIKMDGLSSVYYLGADNKRYVFPNEATYFSWYSDFSGVVTIPQAELESYPLGKNVTVRPGTKLVKITTNPKVYAVTTNGMLLAIPDEATAKALYGDMWAKRVVDVADSFFQNYTISTYTVSATAYPAGSLVKFGTDATVYYIAEDGTARSIASEAVMAANRFKMSDVISATIAAPMTGTSITGAESALTDTASGAGGVANAGTGVSVSLSGDTAASASLPSLSYLVPFMSVNLTAAADGNVVVNELTFARTGTGAYGDFDGGYLYVGADRLSTKKSVTSDNKLVFTALNLTIPAGTTKTVTLKMNATDDANSSHAFRLVSASSIVTNGAVVSGSFPITGNTMSFNSSVNAGSIVFDGAAAAGINKKVGETGVILGEFDMEVGAGEDVYVQSLNLKQAGDAASNAVTNLSVEIDNVTVATGLTLDADKYLKVVFDTAYKIEKSTSVTVVIRGDIVTDINKTVAFILKNDGDAVITGSAYGTNYSPAITRSDFDATGEVNVITIIGSDINVSFDGPLASDIKDNTKDVVFANFKIKANSDDVNIDTLTVDLVMNAANAAHNLDNIEMVDSGNNVSYTVSDPTATATTTALAFENIFLTKGVQYNFAIRGDVPDGVAANTTYAMNIDFGSDFTANFQDADETTVTTTYLSTSTLNGKTMTVQDASVTLVPVVTSNATYVENTDKVLLFKGKITANAVSDLKISKLSIATPNIGDAFERLYLYVGDTLNTVLDDESSLSTADDVAFTGFSLTVPKGTSNGVYVTVRGDVKNDPTAATYTAGWKSGIANYTIKDGDNTSLTSASITTATGQSTTISGAGTFTMAFDSNYTGINSIKNVLAGAESMIGRIKFTARNEDVKIEDFTLVNNLFGTATGTADDIAYLNLYSDSAMTTKIGTATLDASNRAEFSDVNIAVTTAASKYVYVGAVVKGINYSTANVADATATAGRIIKLDIASTTGYTVKALGVSTGDQLLNTGVASSTQTNTATIMGAVISNITSAFANSTLSNGISDIFSFKVTAPESSNLDYDMSELGVKIATTTFTVSSSTGTTLSLFKIERVGGASGEVDASAIVAAGGNFTIGIIDSYAGESSDDLIVRPGETAEFIIKATIAGVEDNDTMKVTMENINAGLTYTHNKATVRGTQDGVVTAVNPLLSGITAVRGGSLTN